MIEDRYARQVLFSPIGEEGQQRLKAAKVLIVGMGALGTVIANHLVRAGVGYVRFVDRDLVEYTNLQRQMLFTEEDAKRALPKAVAAKKMLQQFNHTVQIDAHVADVNPSTIHEFGHDVHILLDGTDNFQTRFVINDYAFQQNKPYVYGGVIRAQGMVASFIPGDTPCLRCMIDEHAAAPETCDTVGVIAPAVDIVASLQASEALKWLTGNGSQLRNGFIQWDVWYNRFHSYSFPEPVSTCLTCQQQQYPSLTNTNEEYVTSLCGRNTIQISSVHDQKWDLKQWKERWERIGDVQHTPFLLRLHVDDFTLVLFPDGRLLIQGTEDVTVAKSLYAKYIGM